MKNLSSIWVTCVSTCVVSVLVLADERPIEHRLENYLTQIAKTRRGAVVRNKQKEVVSIFLTGDSLDATNLSLLGQLDSLTTLIIRDSLGTLLTAEKMALAATCQRLTNIELRCFGALEPGVFAQVCAHRRLLSLKLHGSYPPSVTEFSAITNMHNLTFFEINCWPSFGKDELALLVGLPQLNTLSIAGTMLKSSDTNILMKCSSLTNLLFVPSQELNGPL